MLGDGAIISDNLFVGHSAPSPDYGRDGSAIEVYGAHGLDVDHNRAVGNVTFAELGSPGTAGHRFTSNAVRSDEPGASFLITRGLDDRGPVTAVVAAHNSVRLGGEDSLGFWCGGVCGPGVLVLRANVISANGTVGMTEGPVDSPGLGGGNNVWHRGATDFALLPGDVRADPRFVGAGDLHLRPGSPAIDHAAAPSRALGDPLRGRAPADGDGDGAPAPDAGAYEFRP